MAPTLVRPRFHRRHLRRLDALVDGELDPAGADAVLTHLDGCWACRAELQLRRLIKASTARISTGREERTRG
ncbi:MAG: zf-HC2 domain-containing protein [Actinomycetota bacterium]